MNNVMLNLVRISSRSFEYGHLKFLF